MLINNSSDGLSRYMGLHNNFIGTIFVALPSIKMYDHLLKWLVDNYSGFKRLRYNEAIFNGYPMLPLANIRNIRGHRNFMVLVFPISKERRNWWQFEIEIENQGGKIFEYIEQPKDFNYMLIE